MDTNETLDIGGLEYDVGGAGAVEANDTDTQYVIIQIMPMK